MYLVDEAVQYRHLERLIYESLLLNHRTESGRGALDMTLLALLPDDHPGDAFFADSISTSASSTSSSSNSSSSSFTSSASDLQKADAFEALAKMFFENKNMVMAESYVLKVCVEFQTGFKRCVFLFSGNQVAPKDFRN